MSPITRRDSSHTRRPFHNTSLIIVDLLMAAALL